MKRALTIGIAGVALAATLSVVTAWSRSPAPVTAADALPAYEILTRVTELGLDPIGQPLRRGPYYVLHAVDPRGSEMRVVADAQFGDILSVAPVRPVNAPYAPRYDRGPRIIHVPQAGEETDDRAGVSDRDELSAAPGDDDEEAAPPPRRQIAPPPQRKTNAPPPARRKPFAKTTTETPAPPAPAERRTVLSVPPPQADGPTPIRPTPRFTAKPESGEKFPPPPPGYTPPAGLSQAAPQNDTPPQGD